MKAQSNSLFDKKSVIDEDIKYLKEAIESVQGDLNLVKENVMKVNTK